MWLLKSPLDQNPRVIYQKFNGDFKSHINFRETKGGEGDDV
jgi:ribosomal protein L33